jgi:hypothetical protein
MAADLTALGVGPDNVAAFEELLREDRLGAAHAVLASQHLDQTWPAVRKIAADHLLGGARRLGGDGVAGAVA